MLSVVACATPEGFGDEQLACVADCCRAQGTECRLVVRSDAPQEALAFLEGVRGPCLGVVESRETAKEALKRKVELARAVTARGADNLLLLLVTDLRLLELFVNQGTRPSGVLSFPPDAERLRRLLERLLAERALQPDDEVRTLTLAFGHTAHRVPLAQVLYLEAQEKRVAIHTPLQCLTVCQSLRTLAGQLGDGFVQCHRAYWVNRAAIRSVDYPRMLLTLRNGEQLPISRSARAAVEAALAPRKEAAPCREA